jgi:hypothetical protein
MPPGLQPAHKMSIILFLERVYGIPDQETFFRLIEEAFIPDIRSATILDTVVLLSILKIQIKSFNRQPLLIVIWH